MKKVILSLVAAVIVCGMATAQEEELSKKEAKGQAYRRSSLTMILMEDPNMDPAIANAVRTSYESAEAPKKFNDHNIDGHRIFIPAEKASEEDLKLFEQVNPPKKESIGKALGKGLLSLATANEDGSGDVAAYLEEQKRITNELGALAYKYLIEQKIPYKVMEKWFQPTETELSLKLIQDRAITASSPANFAEMAQSADGLGLLTDAGYDLIGNTFIAVSRYRYMTYSEFSEEMAKEADAVTGGLGLGDLAKSVTDLTSEVTSLVQKDEKHSYVIAVRTYLFQLVWDEETDKAVQENMKNVEGFKAIPFKLKYVGHEKSHASLAQNKDLTNDQIVSIATYRAFDKAIAKLEKKYEAFHIKTPLIAVDPEFRAEIGTYDSVEGKDMYEVLEERYDEETKRTVYIRKGVLTVDGKKIWDNDPDSPTYMDPAAPENEGKCYTVLTGKVKDVAPGYLIRRTKK